MSIEKNIESCKVLIESDALIVYTDDDDDQNGVTSGAIGFLKSNYKYIVYIR
jgi:hypothetical protein